MACIFLAGKVEEDVMKIEDVLKTAYLIGKGDILAEPTPKLQEKIFMYERIILNTLSFDVSVEHPHDYVHRFIKQLTPGRQRESMELSQVTFNILNDSLYTTICLRYPPRLIAASCVVLAIRFLGCRSGPTKSPKFVEIFMNFEKSGKVFGSPIHEIRLLEEEMLKLYENLASQMI